MADETRYTDMVYKPCGKSGIKLPAISLGLWQNWGRKDSFENATQMVLTAFDRGITHFDLANNYGPPPGAAEETFGRILKDQLSGYRDQLLISTKAGHEMWSGPYGTWGSRKHLVSSLDQSLKRLDLDYVDIFYHHRPDGETPLEETMTALDYVVRSGKALYVGISRYDENQTARAASILRSLGTPCLIHQPRYNLFDRTIENGLLDCLKKEGIGCVVYSPLSQGLLSDKYLQSIPPDSRAAKGGRSLSAKDVSNEKKVKIEALNRIAKQRNQSLSQMAVKWVLRHREVTSAVVGASKPEQIEELVKSLASPEFTQDELKLIDAVLV